MKKNYEKILSALLAISILYVPIVNVATPPMASVSAESDLLGGDGSFATSEVLNNWYGVGKGTEKKIGYAHLPYNETHSDGAGVKYKNIQTIYQTCGLNGYYTVSYEYKAASAPTEGTICACINYGNEPDPSDSSKKIWYATYGYKNAEYTDDDTWHTAKFSSSPADKNVPAGFTFGDAQLYIQNQTNVNIDIRNIKFTFTPIGNPVVYTQNFENATDVSDILGFSLSGGTASVINDNGNKVLKVDSSAQASKLAFTVPKSTSKKTIEVSYKVKYIDVGSGGWDYIFSARQGENEVASAFRMGTQLLQYTYGSGTTNNQRLFYCDEAKNDGIYREVKYVIDFENKVFNVTVNDDASLVTKNREIRTSTATGVNQLYFYIPKGDVIYFDDICIKDETLTINSAYPSQGSKNYIAPSKIILNMSAQILDTYLTADYIKLYENGKLLDNYTITQPSIGKISITPTGGFKGNAEYKVVIAKEINSEPDGYVTPKQDIEYSFTTEGFLITSNNDSVYGGKVFTNGKTYHFETLYTNDTDKTQNPIVFVALKKNNQLQHVDIKDGYTVNVGDNLNIAFDYTVSDFDENTTLDVYLWDGLSSMEPLSEKTSAIGEYADGTPAYEARQLAKLKEKHDAKNTAGFTIGVITDVQPGMLSGYKSYLHHYKSLVKATKIIDVDCLADMGDMINHAYDKEEGLAFLKQQSDVLKESNLPIIRVPGNHDDNRAVVNIKGDASYFITREEWLKACDVNWATTMDGTTAGVKTYYYKDFEDDKIRVIALDTLVTPFDVSNKSWLFGYSGEEMEWFANEALKFTDKTDASEWGVVILGHTIGGGYNNSEMQTILQAFMDGKSGSVTGTSTVAPMDTVSYDFTAQGPMEYICAFQGHYHQDKDEKMLGKPLITVTSSLPDNWSDEIPYRDLKSDTEDGWDIVTIDRKYKKIYCTRFGVGSDREFSY